MGRDDGGLLRWYSTGNRDRRADHRARSRDAFLSPAPKRRVCEFGRVGRLAWCQRVLGRSWAGAGQASVCLGACLGALHLHELFPASRVTRVTRHPETTSSAFFYFVSSCHLPSLEEEGSASRCGLWIMEDPWSLPVYYW